MSADKELPSQRTDRLRLMRGILAWEGSLGNTRVGELFGVGLIQASRMLRELRDSTADALKTATRARVLVACRPKDLKVDVTLDEYLALAKDSEANKAVLVDYRIDMTRIPPHIFAMLRQSALDGTGLQIVYASMANPIPSPRNIFPHTLS